ncbi:alpha/beta hydrolase family protein [Pseudofulvibacter geojedonensis]|uniref:Alpha/beta hydrolase family protein n=1 Tax=Pseudofulvibacter geojedonensis TaxID=1123758 RepID=A0ABW3I4G8_9FLAO
MTKTFKDAKLITLGLVLMQSFIGFSQTNDESKKWQKPDEDILKIIHAPKLPQSSISPTGTHMLLSDPIIYPDLAELGSTMHKLAGLRVNPQNNYTHGRHGGVNPRILSIKQKTTEKINLPEGAELLSTSWTTNGKKAALSVGFEDRIELWLYNIDGALKKVENVTINPLLGSGVSWLPDQENLLIRKIPNRGAAPTESKMPTGPIILQDKGAKARSTYESRNLLKTNYDDELFSYYTISELVVYSPKTNQLTTIGQPDYYNTVSYSPDGNYILVSKLKGPWPHDVAYWRFAKDIEVWDKNGKFITNIASLPVANQVPVHGVAKGPRTVMWCPIKDNTLYWVEALDEGNPVKEASFRDKIVRLQAPFSDKPEEVYKAKNRILYNQVLWGEENGVAMIFERKRKERKRYISLLDVNTKKAKLWFEFNESDTYNNPGFPIFKNNDKGKYVFKTRNNAIYFRGEGGSKKGNRPFLDLRNIKTGKSERIFRCDPEKYEFFTGFTDNNNEFIFRSESSSSVPNYYLAKIGKKKKAIKGEPERALTIKPITNFKDPSPELRKITKRIVTYKRKDGVPLSFQLLLPPGYKEGTKLPTVVYAYPREYSGAKTAGQVRGSSKRFMRVYGASHLYFLLKGYAILDQTAMPMIGDPETVYDTFVEQLVDDAEAAVNKAIEIGIADPDRIGIIGHSHGGLMVANLLAHTDLFAAGIARSGSYNKTNQPFGFQSERRSLFEAREAYINLSPTFFADKVNEPILIIHGDDDANPGTLTAQSEVFYEAVRGSGGNARLVLLPFEDHGYRAKESIEHVVWEQIKWFDKYLKNK